MYKAIAVYDRPSWRDLGPSELLVLGSPGFAVFDGSPPGAGPRCWDIWRHTWAVRCSVPVVGTKSWHRDESAGGGYTGLPAVGTIDGLYPMPSEPVGVVHWAGSETAREHPGYFEGAIEAGERAAREVIATLTR